MRFRRDAEIIWAIAAIGLPVMIAASIVAKLMGLTP